MKRLILLLTTALAVAGLTAGPAVAAGPSATTTAATGVTSTGATLNGTVDPAGQAVVSCSFQYGVASPYLGSASCPPLSGTGPQNVSVSVTGLTPGTRYSYQIVLVTVPGGVTTSNPTSFTTSGGAGSPPTGSTGAASDITGTGATLNATVNPQGAAVTSCEFDLGTTTGYGATVPCSSTPSGSSDQNVTGNATGLSPDTQYHFRIVVKTSGGTLTGNDSAFTTAVVGAATTLPPQPLTATTATLHGSVNPDGLPVTSCAFYIGTGRGFQSSAPCSPTPSGGSGTQAVSAAIQGLKPTTAYHVVVVLQTSNGYATGNVVDFTTRAVPTGATGGAGAISATGAVLHGRVNPHGAQVIACVFEYGVTRFDKANANSPHTGDVACSPRPSGTATLAVTGRLRKLAPHTRYYYRVLMETQGGILIGGTRSFMTRRAPRRRKHG
jgi:hypothetical protein